ncbi:MAG: DUF4339 domain-containing protein [Treponema sp.]|jgi:hypothetical protein|nr:DUF4339 domain-containing protein [Treponema sp.]
MKKNKVFILGTFVLLTALFSGCSSSPYRTYDTSSLINENRALILLTGGEGVGFDDEDGIVGKINGEIFGKGESDFLINVSSTVNEVMFIVDNYDRGLIGRANKCVKAIISYQFEAGKTYLLAIHQSKGSTVGGRILGAFVPTSFEYTLYSGTKADRRRILLNGKMEKLDTDAIKSTNAGPVNQQTQVTAGGTQNVSSRYSIAINGQSQGPYEPAVLRQMVQQGTLTRETLVWKEGMAQWAAAGTVQELASLFAAPPPLPPPPLPPALPQNSPSAAGRQAALSTDQQKILEAADAAFLALFRRYNPVAHIEGNKVRGDARYGKYNVSLDVTVTGAGTYDIKITSSIEAEKIAAWERDLRARIDRAVNR